MSWYSRLKNALNPQRLDQDLAEELQDHMRRRAEDLQQSGLSGVESQRRAAIAFGSLAEVRESSREQRLWAGLESGLQDVRYAWRGLRRNPIFAVTAVVSLGLAIGANTAIYSIIDAALLRPLPVPEAGRLVNLATSGSESADNLQSGDRDAFSYPMYQQLREAAGNASRLALFDSPNRVEARTYGVDAPYEEVIQQLVSPDAFEVLGVPPALGASFSMAEDHYPGPRAVAVLSYEYWRRRFGSDPTVLGRRLTLDNREYSILGVAGKGFSGPEPGKFVDVWLPITVADPGIFVHADVRMFRVMGRLASGVEPQDLSAKLQPVFRRQQDLRIAPLAKPPGLENQKRTAALVVESGANGIAGFRQTFSRPLWILLGVSGCILLIACANVAGLLLARASARSSEMALRVSLGARRTRLIRQLLTESLLISFLAGLVGWLLTQIAAPALLAIVSTKDSPVQLDLALETHTLIYCAAICTLSALFFGILPAWQSTGRGPSFELRQAGVQAGRLPLGRYMVGVQVAFAFCLVTCGAGFLFSLRKLASVDLGFDSKGVTVVSMVNTAQRDRQLPLMQQIQARVAALPGVNAAATAWTPVFSGARRAQRIVVPGKPASEQTETFYRVSPGYFATLHTPLLSGRDLASHDNDDEPVATVVNRAFARKYFGAELVLGKEFRRDDGVRHQVVGVAADSRFGSLRNGPEPIAYMPMKPPRAFTLYVHSTMDSISVARMVAQEAAALAPGLRVRDVISLEQQVGNTIRIERLLAGIGGAFGILGLLLAATGLFGLLNYTVTRQTREIGIRTVLGAQRPSIYGFVLKDLSATMAGGLLAGLFGAFALMRLVESFLFGITPGDPMVIGTAMAIFVGVATVAAGLPVRRAASIDPAEALRHD